MGLSSAVKTSLSTPITNTMRDESIKNVSSCSNDGIRSTVSNDRKSKKQIHANKSNDIQGLGHADRWEIMFNQLVEYRKRNGHCLVPNRYREDPKLGTWVATQRRQYKIVMSKSGQSSPMTPQRASRLEQIAFEWRPKENRSVTWEERYKELADFVKKNGHAQVPMRMEENEGLSHWVSTQRQEYKLLQKGLQSRMSPERFEALQKLGFVWEAKRGKPINPRSQEDQSKSTEKAALYPKNMRCVRQVSNEDSTDSIHAPSASFAAVEYELEMIKNVMARRAMESNLYSGISSYNSDLSLRIGSGLLSSFTHRHGFNFTQRQLLQQRLQDHSGFALNFKSMRPQSPESQTALPCSPRTNYSIQSNTSPGLALQSRILERLPSTHRARIQDFQTQNLPSFDKTEMLSKFSLQMLKRNQTMGNRLRRKVSFDIVDTRTSSLHASEYLSFPEPQPTKRRKLF